MHTATTATFTEVSGVLVQEGGRLRGPVLGLAPVRGIEQVEGMALGKAMGAATAPGSAITPHERVQPVVIAAGRPIVRRVEPCQTIVHQEQIQPSAPPAIVRPIDQRTAPPEERSRQLRRGPRVGAREDRRMAGTSQGAARGHTARAVCRVAAEADTVVAGEGVPEKDATPG